MHANPNTAITACRGRRALCASPLLIVLATLALLGASATPSGASTTLAPCRAILNESQLEHVNELIERGAIQERVIFGPRSIRLETVSRHGKSTKLHAIHARHGNAQLAFEYNCPAILEVSVSKRVEICAPNSVKEKIVCEKRWIYIGKSHRWIHLDEPIHLNIAASRDRMVSVGLTMYAWFIPGHYALQPDAHSSELRFGGS